MTKLLSERFVLGDAGGKPLTIWYNSKTQCFVVELGSLDEVFLEYKHDGESYAETVRAVIAKTKGLWSFAEEIGLGEAGFIAGFLVRDAEEEFSDHRSEWVRARFG